ncbi:MAG: alkaline phosphatase [Clostridia bacterium]|nr:alkaline phosphatase [Clostridia bacterium]
MKKILFLILTCIATLALLSSCALFNSSTINGEKLSSYKIVYSADDHDYSYRAAEYIQSSVKTRTGVELKIVEDDQTEGECEIIVGETSRSASASLDADCSRSEFAILSDGTKIALEGDYFLIAAAAYYFVETFVPTNNYQATVPSGVSVCEPIVKEAKNFIMLIGDGMGQNHTKLFDVLENDVEYGDGEDIFYGYYLSAIGYSRTNSLTGTTDSAAGGTALSSGHKTYNEHIGIDADGNDVLLITELASSLGKSTAVMSTETKTGATPASFSAHAEDRDGKSAILQSQIQLTSQYGTLIDCGYDYYTSAKLLGIEDKIRETLDTLDNDGDGFFLMYEEAHIDKHSHNNDTEKLFLALVRFNQAIATFMEYAFYHPDTMVIITADHETGGLTEGEGEYYFTYGDHTSADVFVFVHGAAAERFDGVSVENIQIPMTVAHLMGKDDFGDRTTYSHLTE